MFRRAFAAALAATALTGTALAQKATDSQSCPEDAPCCGLYNDCGTGAFCVQGCDPVRSHSIKACVPNPQCKSAEYKMGDMNRIQSIDKFLGDASDVDWVSQGKPIKVTKNGQDGLLLTLAEGTSGTVLSSTHYVWYGQICATMVTSKGAGVVTAFIMMSDAKDEIDFEWVGIDVNHVQSNYYSQGVTNYNNGRNLTVSNTFENVQEYCLDWTQDTLKWTVDGDELRSLERKTTWNSTANRFDYPQTPSRIMLSLWPAGLPTTAKGTRDWAGGLIDWNSPYMDNGYYSAMVRKVTVKCYSPPDGHKGNGKKTYLYTDRAATNNTIELSDNEVILGSLLATGEDPDEGATTKPGAPKPTKTANSVPGGIVGGGNRDGGEDVSSAAAKPTGADGKPQETSGGGTQGGGGDGSFDQGLGSNEQPVGKSPGANIQPGFGKLGGGAIAIVVAFLGLVVL